ncbi:MAG TPA: signal peptidase II [Ktedonobacterales bacterium]
MNLSTARQKDLAMVGMGILVVVVDQLTKQWILNYFTHGAPKPAIPILGEFLELQFIGNSGVAFSMLEGQNLKFILIGLAIAAICYLYWRTRETGSLLLKVSFGLVLGGAVGNLIDRFVRGYVVDFIHVQIPQIGFNFAVFNMADSAISVGVVLLAFLLWRDGTQESATAGTAESQGASTNGQSFSAMVGDMAQRASRAAQELRARAGAATGADGRDGRPQG